MKFKIEYERPFIRGIFFVELDADNKESVEDIFKSLHPKCRIRSIKELKEGK